MRLGVTLALIVFMMWAISSIRQCAAPEVGLRVCTKLCDIRGRELASISPGLVTTCMCGAVKKAPPTLKRP